MSRRYLNLDQFRTLATEHQNKGDSQVLSTADLAVMAPFTPQIRALGDSKSRLIECVISDESVDRYSDIIKVDGWDIADFENNPVVLWAHSHYDPPVGKAVSIEIKKKAKQVKSIAEFTPRDLNPFGYMIYEMFVQKFMNAVSVGFMPKEWAWVSSDTDAERSRRGGIDYLKQSLLEYSAVPVPANPNALQLALKAGIDTAPLKHWAERVLDESKERGVTDEWRQRLELLRSAASPAGRPLVVELTAALPKEEKKEEAPVTSKVKRIEQWDCGTAGHSHATEKDAEACLTAAEEKKKLPDTIKQMIHDGKSADEIIAVAKAGRVLSKKNEAALRAAVEAAAVVAASLASVLEQLNTEDDEEDDEEEDDDEKAKKSAGTDTVIAVKTTEPETVVIKADPDLIAQAVKKAVTDVVERLGGRVD